MDQQTPIKEDAANVPFTDDNFRAGVLEIISENTKKVSL